MQNRLSVLSIAAVLLLSAVPGNAQQPKTNQVSTQWQATQNFLQSIQNQINQLKGDSGLSIQPGGAGQFAGYNANGTVLSPMVAPVSPGLAGQPAGYPANGSTVGPITNMSVSVNGVVNVTTKGAVADGTTDNTASIQSAITSLAPTGGTVFFPSGSGPYNFSSQINIPKNVVLQCGGAPNSTTLHYTGTTGAALVWSDPPIPTNPSNYYMGGWKDCYLLGPGYGTNTIGVYNGGDPASVISPAANYGDMLTYWGGKIEGFGTAYQVGNNVWEVRFYSTIMTSNNVGYYLPNNIVQPGENMSMIGGSIQNNFVNGVVCNNANADITFTNVSFDGDPSGAEIEAGTATGSQQGCGVTLQDDHFEYFGNSEAAPVFSEWGLSPYTNIKVQGGVLQFDDSGGGFTLPAIANVTGGGTQTINSVTFTLDGSRISSNGGIIFTNTCKLKGDSMCVSGDDAVAGGASVSNYGYWHGTNAQNVMPSRQWGPVVIPGTTTNTDFYGAAIFDSPVFIKRMTIGYASPGTPACTTYPWFYVRDVQKGLNGGSCQAAAGQTSCLENFGAQAMYINAGDTVTVGTSGTASGCTAGTNFQVTLEFQ